MRSPQSAASFSDCSGRGPSKAHPPTSHRGRQRLPNELVKQDIHVPLIDRFVMWPNMGRWESTVIAHLG
jgi:hypothetical protein